MNTHVIAKASIGVVACLAALCLLLLAGCGQGSASSAGAGASGSAAAASSNAAASSSASGESATAASADAGSTTGNKAQADGPYATGVHHAELTVEGYDPITIQLDADQAPASVANFCALAENGYYDGLTFYRFVDGFVMQGGTAGNSASGHDPNLKPIVGEFATNGYDNALADSFGKGTVAMARSSDPDSATSTFFITLDSSQGVSMSLDGQYAAFGTIDDAGMAIVDQIVADYLPNVTDPGMGAIADESKQAKIASLKIVD